MNGGELGFARVARGMSIKVVLLLVAAHVARALPVDPRSLRPPLTYAESFKASATSPVEMTPIGYCESPYKERFGTPRQSVVTAQTAGGSAAQEGAIVLASHIPRETLRDLDGFSHVWIIASLHLNTGWKPLIKPPRGPRNVKRGLFSTRAPHRPNQISLSAVEIVGVDVDAGRVTIRGLDLIDGTPILDMKPYVAYCDSFPDSRAGWIDELDGPADGPDRLNYWPPPSHLMPGAADAGAAREQNADAGADPGIDRG